MSGKKNPFSLCYYNADWSEAKTRRNNTRYWNWEEKNNGFVPPQHKAIKLVRNVRKDK